MRTVTKTYKIRDAKNGLYAFIIDGEAEIEGQKLNYKRWVWNLE